ncbi:ABC transporter ATP-binding protein [Desulfuribacillus alkaliarsenatis]|uniref:Iron ABC transporter ATP-binding protein n=1 Tax=Desulfuribacillus alkaliarsenatis TaxID=766136 RepID=A0A1E5G0A4_9FIRM|nr:ABC transporter ATP-binding protein [Desulfuribacillus alkaliarsenatis]OEF95907.1 iron ABC transporter ATP-binding protein [Desulfuribacillus alkaliarsenatis]
MDKLINITDASFQYNKKNIFHNLNFQLNQGEILCLFGPNGCGKSTLLMCLLGLLQLDRGSVSLQGQNIEALSPRKIAQQIAYVPQVHKKTFPYKVIDIVLMGRAAKTPFFGGPDEDDLQIAENALELVGMKRYRDTPYTMLSGGETQLVMLARALAQETPIIIMDEPTAHLDFRHELIILENMVRLVKEQGVSVIMATHFPNHAFYFENERIATSVALMNNHTFAAYGEPNKVLTEENMKKTFRIRSKLVSYDLGMDKSIRQIIPVNTIEAREYSEGV